MTAKYILVGKDVQEVDELKEELPLRIKNEVTYQLGIAVRKEVNAQVAERVTNALNEALKGS